MSADLMVVDYDNLRGGMVTFDALKRADAVLHDSPYLITTNTKGSPLLTDFKSFYTRPPSTAPNYIVVNSELIIEEITAFIITTAQPKIKNVVRLISKGKLSNEIFLISRRSSAVYYQEENQHELMFTNLSTFQTLNLEELKAEYNIDSFSKIESVKWNIESYLLVSNKFIEWKKNPIMHIS